MERLPLRYCTTFMTIHQICMYVSEVGFEPVNSYMIAQCLIHSAIMQYYSTSNQSLKHINIADAERNPNGKAAILLFTKVHSKTILFSTTLHQYYFTFIYRTDLTSSCNRIVKILAMRRTYRSVT